MKEKWLLKTRRRKISVWQIVCGKLICHSDFARYIFFYVCGKFWVAIYFATGILPEILFFADVANFFGQFHLPLRFCHLYGFLFLLRLGIASAGDSNCSWFQFSFRLGYFLWFKIIWRSAGALAFMLSVLIKIGHRWCRGFKLFLVFILLHILKILETWYCLIYSLSCWNFNWPLLFLDS